MVSGDRRYCDICDLPILECEPYRVGAISDEALRDMLGEGSPRTCPTYTPQADGSAYFEICLACVAEAPQLNGMTVAVAGAPYQTIVRR